MGRENKEKNKNRIVYNKFVDVKKKKKNVINFPLSFSSLKWSLVE